MWYRRVGQGRLRFLHRCSLGNLFSFFGVGIVSRCYSIFADNHSAPNTVHNLIDNYLFLQGNKEGDAILSSAEIVKICLAKRQNKGEMFYTICRTEISDDIRE